MISSGYSEPCDRQRILRRSKQRRSRKLLHGRWMEVADVELGSRAIPIQHALLASPQDAPEKNDGQSTRRE
jgi:hypothetical protein